MGPGCDEFQIAICVANDGSAPHFEKRMADTGIGLDGDIVTGCTQTFQHFDRGAWIDSFIASSDRFKERSAEGV